MKNDYWIYDWAKFRQSEVVSVPKAYQIHSDFTHLADENEIRDAFAQINALYSTIYGDIADAPEAFGMPLREKEKFRWFSKEWNESGKAPFNPFILLHQLFTCGSMDGDAIVVPIEKYKDIPLRPRRQHPQMVDLYNKKIANAHFLFNKLTDYGFVFEGLKNNKIADNDIIISYPGNTALLHLWKMLADKTYAADRFYDFLYCSFRLLQDDMHTANYGDMEDMIDKVPTEREKAFVYKMDETLMSLGLFRKLYGGYEGPGLAYYHSAKVMESKGPYSFRMVSRSPDISNYLATERLLLGLRIRNVSRCLEYLKNCPDSVKRIFTDKNDSGCGKRTDGTCKHGISYEIDDTKYWRCACCHTAFNVKPRIEDIPHYIKLVELGEKKF